MIMSIKQTNKLTNPTDKKIKRTICDAINKFLELNGTVPGKIFSIDISFCYKTITEKIKNVIISELMDKGWADVYFCEGHINDSYFINFMQPVKFTIDSFPPLPNNIPTPLEWWQQPLPQATAVWKTAYIGLDPKAFYLH